MQHNKLNTLYYVDRALFVEVRFRKRVTRIITRKKDQKITVETHLNTLNKSLKVPNVFFCVLYIKEGRKTL